MIYKDAMESAMVPQRADKDWIAFASSFNSALDRLEQIVDDVSSLRGVCHDEWCDANECMLDEASIFAFSISEPHWASDEDSGRLKKLKKRIHDLFGELKPSMH